MLTSARKRQGGTDLAELVQGYRQSTTQQHVGYWRQKVPATIGLVGLQMQPVNQK
jgi:hypothetical protein